MANTFVVAVIDLTTPSISAILIPISRRCACSSIPIIAIQNTTATSYQRMPPKLDLIHDFAGILLLYIIQSVYGKERQEVISNLADPTRLNVRKARVGGEYVQGLAAIEFGRAEACHSAQGELGGSFEIAGIVVVVIIRFEQVVGCFAGWYQFIYVNRPLQIITQSHNLRPAPPITLLPHQLAILLPRQIELRRRRGQKFLRLQILLPLQEQSSPSLVLRILQHVHGGIPQPQRAGPQRADGRVGIHGEMRSVDRVVEAGGDGVEEAVAVAGDLAYLHGNVEGFGVRALVAGAVLAANVGEDFPFSGRSGVAVGEEAAGIDFGGGVPWGVVGV